jgi:acetyl esterase/lipase
VADRGGVSPSAVSLALRNHPSIAAPDGARLRALAKKLGYRPEPPALERPVARKTKTAMKPLRPALLTNYPTRLSSRLFLAVGGAFFLWWNQPLTVAAAASDPASSSSFTVERVLSDLQQDPRVSRVSGQLPAGLTAVENIVYARPDGRELLLDVYRPVGSGPFPAILIIHGGGWDAGSREMERAFAKQLAARGYITVPVSYRLGADGRFPAALHDLKTAVRWLRTRASDYTIDPTRIGVVGGSAGGHLAALLGASNGIDSLEGTGEYRGKSSGVQAVVDIDGAASFPDAALIAQEEKRPGATSRFLGGNYSQRRAVWFEASPLTYVSRTSAPTLFIKSTAPRPILPGRDEMCDRLKALGIDSAVIQFADTPHPFWLVHPWFEKTVAETDAFLRRHLLNKTL